MQQPNCTLAGVGHSTSALSTSLAVARSLDAAIVSPQLAYPARLGVAQARLARSRAADPISMRAPLKASQPLGGAHYGSPVTLLRILLLRQAHHRGRLGDCERRLALTGGSGSGHAQEAARREAALGAVRARCATDDAPTRAGDGALECHTMAVLPSLARFGPSRHQSNTTLMLLLSFAARRLLLGGAACYS